MKKVLLLGAAVALSGCQLLTDSVDVAASTIFASDSVDAMQTELGDYSDNQTALVELDQLQAEIKETLTTGDNALYVESYRARALIIYSTLKDEAVSRWTELSTEQQASMIALDNELIALNESIEDMLSSVEAETSILDMIYRATILMTYYKGI